MPLPFRYLVAKDVLIPVKSSTFHGHMRCFTIWIKRFIWKISLYSSWLHNILSLIHFDLGNLSEANLHAEQAH
jgi:hypothetical protein